MYLSAFHSSPTPLPLIIKRSHSFYILLSFLSLNSFKGESVSHLGGWGKWAIGGEVMAFDYSLDYKQIDFRESPELYRVGRGEQGVLMVEPYKSEILPHWKFKTPAIAQESSEKIHAMFLDYQKKDDFVGMDMARKFLQMGYTRARRYANYPGGKKYDKDGNVNDREIDDEKAESASIFEEKWIQVREDPDYLKRKKQHQKKYG